MRSSLSRSFLLVCIALLLLIVVAHRAAHAAVPSFLCSKGKTWLEKTVCKSERLSELDMDTAMAYSRMLRGLSGSSERAFVAEQNKFWAARSSCQKDKDPESCLEGRYEARIAAIKSRSDYPGDEIGPREVIITETLIKETGPGWSQQASDYMKAIRACAAKTAPKPRAVLTVWTEEEGELVLMRMRGAAGEDLLCMARKDGSEPSARPREQGEEVPAEGPILWLGGSRAPKGSCGKPVQVLDTDDTPVGWLAPAKC